MFEITRLARADRPPGRRRHRLRESMEEARRLAVQARQRGHVRFQLEAVDPGHRGAADRHAGGHRRRPARRPRMSPGGSLGRGEIGPKSLSLRGSACQRC